MVANATTIHKRITAALRIWYYCQSEILSFWMSTHRPKNPEEGRGHLCAQIYGTDREDAYWKSETPPAHVELERLALVNAGEGEDEPHKSKAPHD